MEWAAYTGTLLELQQEAVLGHHSPVESLALLVAQPGERRDVALLHTQHAVVVDGAVVVEPHNHVPVHCDRERSAVHAALQREPVLRALYDVAEASLFVAFGHVLEEEPGQRSAFHGAFFILHKKRIHDALLSLTQPKPSLRKSKGNNTYFDKNNRLTCTDIFFKSELPTLP